MNILKTTKSTILQNRLTKIRIASNPRNNPYLAITRFIEMKPLQTILYLLTLAALSSCGAFHRLAGHTQVGSEEVYKKVYNPKANLKTLTYGDFLFATSVAQYDTLAQGEPPYSNILFYAKTAHPPHYDYYVLLNPPAKYTTTEEYVVKDTTLGHQHLVVLISQKAPKSDREFITQRLYREHGN